MSVDPVATRRLIESLSTHLEDHLATWKSSLVDARRDIEKLLAALSDKIPAHAQPLLPEELMSLMLEDVMPAPAVAAAPPSPPQADWNVGAAGAAAVAPNTAVEPCCARAAIAPRGPLAATASAARHHTAKRILIFLIHVLLTLE